MRGCRPLGDKEIHAVAQELDRGPRDALFRNVALWFLLLKSGLRISEALALKVSDVLDGQAVRTHVSLRRKATKGRNAGATLPLHPLGIRALRTYFRCEVPLPLGVGESSRSHRGSIPAGKLSKP